MSELSATKARERVESLESEKIRGKRLAEARKQRLDTLIAFGATRVASNLLTVLWPASEGFKPIAEVGGGAFAASKALKGNTRDNSGYYLGAACGALTGPLDKLSQLVVDTVQKFTDK